MTIVALGMNGLLALLLIAALAFGIRLDRKLKGVRDGQTAFTQAVAELDSAVARAHAGLAELRAATDEATDHLGGRIARAREASERLEKLLGRAETMPAQSAARPGPEGGLAALLASVAEAAETISGPAVAEDRAPEMVERSRPERVRIDRPARRLSVDDDLFEDAGGRA